MPKLDQKLKEERQKSRLISLASNLKTEIITTFNTGKGKKKIKNLIVEDAHYLIKMLTYIACEEFDKAINLGQQLDSAAREVLPQSLYYFIMDSKEAYEFLGLEWDG